MRTTLGSSIFIVLAACGGGGGGPGDDTPACGDGTLDTGEQCDDGNTDSGDGCSATCTNEPPTAARLDTMTVADPHLFAFGGFDVTDMVNQAISDGITTDMTDPPDGVLDLSLVLLFRPWDPQGSDGRVDAVAGAACTAPVAGTMCMTDAAATTVIAAAENSDSTCLSPMNGTTGDYNPPVVTPSGRCFSTDKHLVNLTLGSITLMLEDTQIAATYSTSGHTLSNGLMLGFISQATADATILPDNLPGVGGMPLSALLLEADKDTGPSGSGWWFYLNFTASEVPYAE
jgi:cysteine-rich repeat protein